MQKLLKKEGGYIYIAHLSICHGPAQSAEQKLYKRVSPLGFEPSTDSGSHFAALVYDNLPLSHPGESKLIVVRKYHTQNNNKAHKIPSGPLKPLQG